MHLPGLRYHACMQPHDASSFARALQGALRAKGMTQADLARRLGIDAGQISRWVNARAVPLLGHVRRLEELLGADLSGSFATAVPQCELFVSAPISALAEEDIPRHHDAVAKVVDAAREQVNSLAWPGGRVTCAGDRRTSAADIVTEENMKELATSSAYLYLQFADVRGPSSALVELGFALGRKKKITMMFSSGLTTPYMLHGFGAVAARLNFLPDARMYEVDSPDEAASLIRNTGRVLLGLT